MTDHPPLPTEMPPPGAGRSPRTSVMLRQFTSAFQGEQIRLADITEGLGKRSFGLLLLLLALPHAIPLPAIPGMSTLLALPLILVALQMLMGMPAPWLPGWLAEKPVRRQTLTAVLDRSLPWLERIERGLHPRLLVVSGRVGERVLGACCLLLACVIAMPIPFGNWLPGMGITLMALGLIERDGLVIVVGAVFGAAGVTFASVVVLAAARAALGLMGDWLGV